MIHERALASPAKEHPMAMRLPASQHTREELTALIEGRLSTASAKDELVKLATRLIVEETLEGEAGDALGREYYEHGAQPGQGYRNGYRPGRLKTAEGRMEYSAPQIAGRDEPFRSAIREHLKGHTQGLEDLAIEMLARGLSVRDIEDAFKDETGRLLLSKTAVSQLGERLWEDYQAFAQRDLSEYEITYLFVDGIAERLRPGAKREPVLAAWGYTVEGRRVLLHLMAGSKEDAETVTAFFEERRRLKIIPNAFGERAVLKLMFGALIRAAERWRSVKVTEFERRQMASVQKELDQEYEAMVGLNVKPSKDEVQVRKSSSSRT